MFIDIYTVPIHKSKYSVLTLVVSDVLVVKTALKFLSLASIMLLSSMSLMRARFSLGSLLSAVAIMNEWITSPTFCGNLCLKAEEDYVKETIIIYHRSLSYCFDKRYFDLLFWISLDFVFDTVEECKSIVERGLYFQRRLSLEIEVQRTRHNFTTWIFYCKTMNWVETVDE